MTLRRTPTMLRTDANMAASALDMAESCTCTRLKTSEIAAAKQAKTMGLTVAIADPDENGVPDGGLQKDSRPGSGVNDTHDYSRASRSLILWNRHSRKR